LAGGGILTRIDREGESEGLTTLAEILTNEAGQIERLNVREWNKSPQAEYQTLRADYVFFADYVQATRRINDTDTEHEEFHFSPQHTLIDLPITIFASLKFKQMTDDLETRFSFLRPIWWLKNSHLIEVFENTPHPDFTFGEINDLTPLYSKTPTIVYYGTMNRFIGVDEHNIPLQCQDHENKTITVLTEYAHI
jgi:hypothetical protein